MDRIILTFHLVDRENQSVVYRQVARTRLIMDNNTAGAPSGTGMITTLAKIGKLPHYGGK